MSPSTRRVAFAIAALAGLPLGACGGVAKQPAATAQGAPAANTAAQDQPGASTDTTAANRARTPIVPFGQLRGLTDTQITAMLGVPQFLRQDAATELWQYRGDGCVLHLFLYRNSDVLRVQHAEVRPRTLPAGVLTGAAADACLTKLTAALPAATS